MACSTPDLPSYLRTDRALPGQPWCRLEGLPARPVTLVPSVAERWERKHYRSGLRAIGLECAKGDELSSVGPGSVGTVLLVTAPPPQEGHTLRAVKGVIDNDRAHSTRPSPWTHDRTRLRLRSVRAGDRSESRGADIASVIQCLQLTWRPGDHNADNADVGRRNPSRATR